MQKLQNNFCKSAFMEELQNNYKNNLFMGGNFALVEKFWDNFRNFASVKKMVKQNIPQWHDMIVQS